MGSIIRGRFAAPTPPLPFRRFALGQLVMTRGIAAQVERSESFAAGVLDALRRHRAGDWGAVCAEDRQANDWSLAHGERLLSVYCIDGEKVYVITERNRSATTVLFPHEY
jgi:hypothetical protein